MYIIFIYYLNKYYTCICIYLYVCIYIYIHIGEWEWGDCGVLGGDGKAHILKS